MGGEEEWEEPPQFVWIMMLGVVRLQAQAVQGSGVPGVSQAYKEGLPVRQRRAADDAYPQLSDTLS
jgi:hypothetical protein